MSKIAVIFGGPSSEHDVSILTGLQAARELGATSHEVIALYWSKTGDWYRVEASLEGKDFLDGVPTSSELMQLVASPGGGFAPAKLGALRKPKPLPIDVAVVCCHGGPGEDGTLQSALDLAGVAYTGPTAKGAALGMDKLAFGAVMQHAGLPTLPRVALTATIASVPFDGPYIVKPRFGGSSIGIEVVDNLETAKALLSSSVHLRAGAVVEPYRPSSFDLNIAIRTFPVAQVSAIEKPTRASSGAKILGYADKYVGGQGMVSAPRELPADLSDADAQSIRSMAVHVAELTGVRGVQRLDFLCDDGMLFVNEVNTIPGSLSKHLFVEPAVAFSELLDGMLREAVERPSRTWTAAGSDGSALRSAGTIAGKLG